MGFLNLTSILTALSLLVIAILSLMPGVGALWNGPGMIFVICGTAIALLFSYSLEEIIRVGKIAWIVMRKKPIHLDQYVNDIFELSIRIRREGLLKSQSEIDALEDPFLRDGLNMLVDGYTSAEARWILEQRVKHQHLRESQEARLFRSMASYAPIFGALAALTQIVSLAQNAAESLSLVTLFGSPLLALVYGLIFSQFIFVPVAERMERRAEVRLQLMQLIVEGVVMINDSWHPAKAREALDSFLPAGKRRLSSEAS